MALFERLVGFRYLKARKRTGFVSVIAGFSFLGIMLGVATLIIVMSVMNGFRDELMGRVLGINGHMAVYPAWGPTFALDNRQITEFEKIHGVTAVMPILEGQVMASSDLASQGALLRGIRPQDFKNRPLLSADYQGKPLDTFQDNQIILGYRLAAKMGVRIGQKLNLISPNGNVTAFGTMPRMKSYEVIGTFDTGMFEYDSNFIFMPLEQAQKYLMTDGQISQVEIFVSDMNALPFVQQEVVSKLPRSQVAVDWKHSNSAFFNAIEVERNVMFLILTLIIIVAAFNIISGLIMLVRDKSKDIAILRTMGASRRSIMTIFLIDGLFVGVVGTLAGLLVGLLVSYNIEPIRQFLGRLAGQDLFSAEIYFLSQLPSKTDMKEVIAVTVMALSLSFLATLYPSWKASKTDPVEALRYE